MHMSRISGIIAFQTKKSNLESDLQDLRKETDIKWVTKGNRKIPHTSPRTRVFLVHLVQKALS